jgi:hypothetical protein
MKNAVFWDIKTQVRTSQEIYHVSATESSRLMLRNISGFHGGDYEECRPLYVGAVWVMLEQMFRKNLSLPSTGYKESSSVHDRKHCNQQHLLQ